MKFRLIVLLVVFGMPGESAQQDHDPWDPPRLSISELPAICEVVIPVVESQTAIVELDHQAWPHYIAVVNHVRFSLGLDDQNRTRYLSTDDAKFTTPDGVGVGWLFEDLQAEFEVEPACDPRSSCFVQLPSGWYAGFPARKRNLAGKAIVYEAEPPKSGDQVSYLFKRGTCKGSAG